MDTNVPFRIGYSQRLASRRFKCGIADIRCIVTVEKV
ncbi:hypothetical protein T09_9669 [Trichinella sp. T9]|nr:hypothetical protein T09_9669 [Trichinella sp. T9]